MTNRYKIINGKKYHLVSSSISKPGKTSKKFIKDLLPRSSIRVVKFNKKEAKFEDANYGIYAG